MSKAETSVPDDLKLWLQGKKAYSQASQRRPTEAGLQRALHPARTSFSLPTSKALTKGRAKKKLPFPQPHPHSPLTLERKVAQVPASGE